MVGQFLYDFTAGDLDVVLPRRTKQGMLSPSLVSHGRVGLVKLEKEDHMRAAAERVQRKTAPDAADGRRRWDRSSKDRKKRANMRSDEDVAAARENVTQEDATARSGQDGLVVVMEDSVTPASEAAAGATSAGVRLTQVSGDAGSQQSTTGADA